jgi:nitrogen fixation protein NifU and related proteins
MDQDLEKKIADAMRNPKNLGEMQGADAIGTAGSANCGDMLRMWIKFKEERGRKVIDKATFQSFGCETAIAVASLATELIRGKTVEEALSFKGADLAQELGPLPPMKIHCSQLVESALHSALAPASEIPSSTAPNSPSAPGLVESMTASQEKKSGVKVVFLDPKKSMES